MSGQQLPGGTFAAVLAAGQASRFGTDKLSCPCAGRPLGRWALAAALTAGLRPVVIARSPEQDWVQGCEIAMNPDAHLGMGTSLALAARLAAMRGAEALLVTLADMPLVTAETLLKLVQTRAPAACRYPSGRPGVPALFPASAFDSLMRAAPDRGAGKLLADLEGLQLIEVQANELFDVDRPEDLLLAESLLAEGPAPTLEV